MTLCTLLICKFSVWLDFKLDGQHQMGEDYTFLLRGDGHLIKMCL